MEPDYDFVIQLRRDTVRDIQIRAINASPLRNLAFTSPLSRTIEQENPPLAMKAHWEKPQLDVTNDRLRLSANIQGGVRHALKQINLTAEGAIHADCRPTVVTTGDNQPVVTLTAPSLREFDLEDLTLSYRGDEENFSWIDTEIEEAILHPCFCTLLMAPLSSMPLSYLPDSLPLRLRATPQDSSTDGLVIADATVALDPQVKSLTLAMRREAQAPVPTRPVNLLEEPMANAVVAMSETGLNSLLGWLCAHESVTGNTQVADRSVVWRWMSATASFEGENLRLRGQLWRDEATVSVDVTLRCALTPAAQLSVRLSTSGPRPPEADLITTASEILIRRILYAATPEPEADSSRTPLQRFAIPGTDISAEASAVTLDIRHGYLTAAYAIPLDKHHHKFFIEKKKPRPTIGQPTVPNQSAPGMPVDTVLHATLEDSTESPYDYAWRIDNGSLEKDHHSTVIVTKTPSFVAAAEAAEPRKFATVKVKVIDILGRVGETDGEAIYYPLTRLPENSLDPSPSNRWWPPTPAIVFAVISSVLGGIIGGAIGCTFHEHCCTRPGTSMTMPSGFTGPIGATGPAGPPGPAGLTGSPGPAGPQGPAGPPGSSGSAGPSGPPEASGPAGPPRPPRAPGTVVIPGPLGPRRSAGPQEPQGIPGNHRPGTPPGCATCTRPLSPPSPAQPPSPPGSEGRLAS